MCLDKFKLFSLDTDLSDAQLARVNDQRVCVADAEKGDPDGAILFSAGILSVKGQVDLVVDWLQGFWQPKPFVQ